MSETKPRSLVDEYLAEKEADGKIREDNVLFATDLTRECITNSYYNITIDTPPSKNLLRVFMSGTLVEDFWVDDVLRNNKEIKIIGTQLPARYTDPIEGFSIHGRIDALVLNKDGYLEVREVKSAKTCAWLTSPKKDHVEQISFYLSTLGIDRGQIDMIDKTIMLLGEDQSNQREDRPPDISFPIQRNNKIFEDIIQRARILHRALKDKVPPPKTVCWLCNGQNRERKIYCEYKDVCDGQTKLDSPPVSS